MKIKIKILPVFARAHNELFVLGRASSSQTVNDASMSDHETFGNDFINVKVPHDYVTTGGACK